ncbi:MAG: GNAT family N-acetyltransferase [Magnetococcales bacterium]|nr:GNAT family N-acetyltransferase [Magnetococcales bacterium]
MSLEIVRFSKDSPLCRQYESLHERCLDACIQQSTLWAEIIGFMGPDEPWFLLAQLDGENIAGLPLYLYRSEAGNLLVSVPQAGPMGGIFSLPDISSQLQFQLYKALLDHALDFAKQQQCIAFSVINTPFCQDGHLYRSLLGETIEFHNFCQVADLDQLIKDGKVHLSTTKKRSNFSRNVRKGVNAGFLFLKANKKQQLIKWYEIHNQRHRELGAEPLPIDIFENMWDKLRPEGKANLYLLTLDDRIVSGAFCINHLEVMDVYMMSMDNYFAKAAPNYMLTEKIMCLAHREGVRFFNWQSSKLRYDSVYSFKSNTGAEEREFIYFTTPLDHDKLRDLGRDGVERFFPGHFLVPFDYFNSSEDQRVFNKQSVATNNHA